MLNNIGSMSMPLHFGKLPNWFAERMGNIGSLICESIIDNYGTEEVLRRISNPNWFQAFGAVMGMQWNSSGVTAAVLGSLKRKINPKSKDLGIYILGGKGKYGWSLDKQVERVSVINNLDTKTLVRNSSLVFAIDSKAIQDSFNLYQKYFILTKEGKWAAINQGMNVENRRARRYHWLDSRVASFTNEPHRGIVGKESEEILNLVDSNADTLRTNILKIIKDKPKNLINIYSNDVSLPDRHDIKSSDVNLQRLGAVLDLVNNKDISTFENLLLEKGVGERTLKSLALVSEIIHGDATRFSDPARFSFAVGGKDGIPHPVDTETYDKTIEILKESVEKSKLGQKDKSNAIKKLHDMATNYEKSFSPVSFIEDFINSEWDHAEKNGGKTFMGDTIKGVTKFIVSNANSFLYGKK